MPLYAYGLPSSPGHSFTQRLFGPLVSSPGGFESRIDETVYIAPPKSNWDPFNPHTHPCTGRCVGRARATSAYGHGNCYRKTSGRLRLLFEQTWVRNELFLRSGGTGVQWRAAELWVLGLAGAVKGADPNGVFL